MRVPTQISVGGRKVQIRYADAMPGEPDGTYLYGTWVDRDSRITINMAAHQNATQVHATLVHELCHAALAVTGHSEGMDGRAEEALVVALENMLAPILAFAPKGAGIRWKDVPFPFE